MWNSHRYVFIPMAVLTAWLYDTTIKLEANYAPAEWYRNCHIAYMENEESTLVGNIILKTTVAYWLVFLMYISGKWDKFEFKVKWFKWSCLEGIFKYIP